MTYLLAGGALALALLPSAPVNVSTNPNIKMVVCEEGRGTAFRVGPSTYVSVNHVTSLTACKIDGKPIAVAYASRAQDFSVVRVSDVSTRWLRIDCKGYNPGQLYYANGYAEGRPFQRILVGLALPYRVSIRPLAQPLQVIWGTQFIPGMSGGPVQNNAGEVVGLVNAYDRFNPISFSRPLKDTILCPRSN